MADAISNASSVNNFRHNITPTPPIPQIIPFFMFHKSAVTNKLKSRRGTVYSATQFKCSNTQIHFIISKKTLKQSHFQINNDILMLIEVFKLTNIPVSVLFLLYRLAKIEKIE